MKTIKDFNFSGKKALVRVDFNVPQNEKYKVTDNTRILASKPTINKILNDGGSVVIMTHLGRPKGKLNEKFSLTTIIDEIQKVLERDIKFCSSHIGSEDTKNMISKLNKGEILVLENLRFYEEEEKGDYNFARQLSELGDIYVNDAFGVAHRQHASTSVIAQFFPQKKCFGLLMEKELKAIDKVIRSGEKPITAILGGSKVSTKIGMIENLLSVVDNLIIGGAMAFTFIKAQGGKLGNSLVENEKLDLALEILKKAKNKGVKVYIPVDFIIAKEFKNDAIKQEAKSNEIPDYFMGLDVGKETQKIIDKVIMNSKTILWNGPLGAFEMPNFSFGTQALADSIVSATKNGAFSLVGGGDSVAFVKNFGYVDKVSYVSTGGGAMMESLKGESLPGVLAINL